MKLEGKPESISVNATKERTMRPMGTAYTGLIAAIVAAATDQIAEVAAQNAGGTQGKDHGGSSEPAHAHDDAHEMAQSTA